MQSEFTPKMGTKVIQWKAKAILLSLLLSLSLHGTDINQYSPTKRHRFRFRFRSV